MRDDLLDYDNQHDTGKPSGNDMREGKLTLPVIHALLETGDEAMKEIALRVRAGEATDEEIAQLVAFTHSHNGIDYTTKKMYNLANSSLSLIDKKGSDPAIAESLHKYAQFVVGREL